jgi:hypothetical protein
MALCQGHDGLMSWAMVDQNIDCANKWIILYVPQEILIEHEKIQDWSRQRAKIGFKIG